MVFKFISRADALGFGTLQRLQVSDKVSSANTLT